MSKRKCRWSEADIKRLNWGWREERPKKIATALGRSECAVIMKAKELGLGPANGGNESVNAFSARIGYTVPKVRKAIKLLGIQLRRGMASEAGKHSIRTFVVEEDDHERIIEKLLANDILYANLSDTALRTPIGMWGVGKKPPACILCGRTDRRHASKGRCYVCYNNALRKEKRKGT